MDANEQGFTRWLREAIEDAGQSDGTWPEVQSFEEAGTLSRDAGLVVEMNGATFVITVQETRSRQGSGRRSA